MKYDIALDYAAILLYCGASHVDRQLRSSMESRESLPSMFRNPVSKGHPAKTSSGQGFAGEGPETLLWGAVKEIREGSHILSHLRRVKSQACLLANATNEHTSNLRDV